MGRRLETFSTEGTVQTGTSAKVLLQGKTPAQGADAIEFSCSFRGASTEVLLEILQGMSDGTTPVAATVRQIGFPSLASPAMTGKKGFAADPTGGEVVFQELVETGYTWRLFFKCKPATNYSIRVTSSADVPASARMVFGVDD